MKHVRAAARYAGIELRPEQMGRLNRFAQWLRDEAYPAGGIGPDELGRLEKRHLADSILFASVMGSPGEVWDLGSGVGLPGIPLALVKPTTRFLLVDRSGRRGDLLRRALRLLDLDNCEVRQGDIEDLTGTVEVIVSRASLPPSQLHSVALNRLAPGGRAIVAGSWQERPEHTGWETIEIPREVLDQTVWLLMMRRT